VERSVQAIGKPPQGVQWIHIGDRYSAIFPLMSLMGQGYGDFVIRAAQDRRVDLLVEQAETPVAPRAHRRQAGQAQARALHLFEVVRGWSAQGAHELKLEASQQSPTRVARVAISYGCVRLVPPVSQEKTELRPLVVWVVRVWEPQPPEGVEALEWVRLSSVPTDTLEQAWERVQWYGARWIIED